MITNIPADLIPGDACLCRTAGIVGDLVGWRENDKDTDHIALYLGDGKVFTSLTKTGVGIYDFAAGTRDIVHIRRPLGTFDLQAVMTWIPTVAGAPYGWGDIESAAGLNETPHYFVPDAALIHQTGADCSDSVAMALEVGKCPQFDPAFDKRRITPAHFKLSPNSREVWKS